MTDEYYHNEYYYSQLLDTIRQRQYKDVPFKLRRLGENTEPFTPSRGLDLINKNKYGCMRGILYIYDNKEDFGLTNKDFQDVIKGARKIGIAWPDLSIIERSVSADTVNEVMRVDLKSTRDRMLERLEHIFNDPGTDVFDRITELEIAYSILHRITQDDVDAILAKYKTRILSDIVNYRMHGAVHIDFPMVVRLLKELGAKWPELKMIDQSVKADKPKLSESPRTHDEIIRDKFDYDIFDGIAALRTYGHQLAEFPKYKQLVTKQKPMLIQSLLDMCVDNKLSMAKFRAEDLKTVGVDWPELTTILKSTTHEINQFFGIGTTDNSSHDTNTNITEDSDDAKRKAEYYKRQIATSVIEDDMITAFELLSEFGWIHRDDLGDLKELNTILNHNKQRIMVGILDEMARLNDADVCYQIPQIIDGLKHAGIHWPDLKHVNTTVDNIQGDLYEYQQPVNNIVHRNRKA